MTKDFKGKYKRLHRFKENSALNVKTQLSNQRSDKDNMKYRKLVQQNIFAFQADYLKGKENHSLYLIKSRLKVQENFVLLANERKLH